MKERKRGRGDSYFSMALNAPLLDGDTHIQERGRTSSLSVAVPHANQLWNHPLRYTHRVLY